MKQYFIVIGMAVIMLTAHAQKRTLSLDDCLRMALADNLSLRSGRIAVQRAVDLQGTSFDLDPTSITLAQDPTSCGSPDNAVTVSQNFSLPIVYSRKRRQLKAETQVERNALELTAAEVRREVTLAYQQLVYEHERSVLLHQQDSLYANFRRVALAQNRVGETGRLELINADRLVSENRMAVKKVERDYQVAQLQLMQWLNTDLPIVPADSSLCPLQASFASRYDGTTTPQALYGESKIKASEAALKSVKSEALPTVSLAASTQLVIKGFNPYDIDRSAFDKGNFMGFEVGLNIPLAFGAQRGRVRAAKRDVEMARVDHERQMQTQAATYLVKLNEYDKAKELLDYYDKEAVARADEMRRISQTSYENGAIGYLELMQNMQNYVDTHLARAEAVRDYNKAVTELNYLLGR